MKGSRYLVFKRGKRWYWCLWLHQHGPIAYCQEHGFASKSAALRSILSAHVAAREAMTGDGDYKVDDTFWSAP